MKKLLFRTLLIGLLVPLWIFLRSVYRDRIGAFGCFDDCFNYMGGYFLLHGKHLYSQIFFNHQPIPAYLSALIQYFTKPDGIYLLIYHHRMFIVYFSMIADALLVLRFGLVGFGFALLYESTKGFLFGEHFLAEAMIVYPLVYLLGMSCHSRESGNPSLIKTGSPIRSGMTEKVDLLLAAIFTWFIVFSREPYVPLALVMFGYLLWKHRNNKVSKISLGIFLLLSVITIGLHSLPDYFFNIVTVNASRPGSEGNFWSMIFYPVSVFFGGQWNLFRWIEVALAILFWILIILHKRSPRRQNGLAMTKIVLLFFFLTLANIRPVSPGAIYYAAFHHLQWYGLFIMSVLLLIGDTLKTKRFFGILGIFGFLGISVWAIFSPQSYLHDKVDRHAEFTTNFDRIFVVGGIVKALSNPNDTLFLDEWDDLIYFQAHRYSPYKYSWYTSSMSQFVRYRQAHDDMFAKTPPTFYYGKCAKDVAQSFPRMEEYVRLMTSKAPTCVFVLRQKLAEITEGQWKQAKEKLDIIKP